MADEPSGFLGRWARRKTDASQGKPLDEPVPTAEVAGPARPAPVPTDAPAAPPVDGAVPAEKVPLSLDDVKLLNKDSDFKPFMAGDVGPEVRNAAMKKLFADPHFNVMDGLDIYIDDYSKPDPIPESMLRQMVGAKFLNLFDDEPSEPSAPAVPPRESANNPAVETVAQSPESADQAIPQPAAPSNFSQPEPPTGGGASHNDHAHTDLRLQPDHAASAPGAGHGTQ